MFLGYAQSSIADDFTVTTLGCLCLFWVFCGIWGAVVASRKGRSAFLGFSLGIILGLIGVIIAYLLGPGKRCPYCASGVMPHAIICPQCGRNMFVPLEQQDPVIRPARSEKTGGGDAVEVDA